MRNEENICYTAQGCNVITILSSVDTQGPSCSFIQICLQMFLFKLFAFFFTNLAHSLHNEQKSRKQRVFASIFFCLGCRLVCILCFLYYVVILLHYLTTSIVQPLHTQFIFVKFNSHES